MTTESFALVLVVCAALVLVGINSFFAYGISSIHKYETRVEYTLRWAVYRWLVLFVYALCAFFLKLCRCLLGLDTWSELALTVNFYMTEGRAEIDNEIQDVYLTKLYKKGR